VKAPPSRRCDAKEGATSPKSHGVEWEEAAAEEEAEHDEIMEEASTIHKVNAFLKRKQVELHISGMGLAIVKNVPRGRYL
jgi:hypothetical protein